MKVGRLLCDPRQTQPLKPVGALSGGHATICGVVIGERMNEAAAQERYRYAIAMALKSYEDARKRSEVLRTRALVALGFLSAVLAVMGAAPRARLIEAGGWLLVPALAVLVGINTALAVLLPIPTWMPIRFDLLRSNAFLRTDHVYSLDAVLESCNKANDYVCGANGKAARLLTVSLVSSAWAAATMAAFLLLPAAPAVMWSSLLTVATLLISQELSRWTLTKPSPDVEGEIDE